MSTMTDSIGRVLAGRYRIESALGTGASAHVFAAWDVTLRRRVAIKLLHPALVSDGAFLRRFRAEAQSAAALTHPHILSVFDWGEDESGPFLVLEFLGGGSLRDLLDGGRHLSVAQAVSVGAQAAQGLAYAHGRGFVHRDVKPANLLFDEESRLRIADFGLARALAEAALTEPAGATVGTARYAAPEQAQGNLVDGKADVYSLALVLYESVTGSVPFTADTTISTLMARVGARIPRDDRLGPLAPVLEQAAAPEAEERLDAAHFARRLAEIAKRLRPPEPLPLAGTSMDDQEARGAWRVGAPVDPIDRTEHGMGRPDTASHEEMDTSHVLAVASAVGVATDSYSSTRQTADPLARVDVPETPGTGSRDVGTPPAIVGRPARTRRWPWVTAIVVLALAIVAGGLAIAAIKVKLFTASRRLPDVASLTLQEASAKLQRDHLDLKVSQRIASTTVAEGEIIGQSPRAGTSLKEGSPVSVIVSTGPPPVDVPSLSQVTSGGCPQAGAVLATAHLHTNCIPESSMQVPDGGVIRWSPTGRAKEFSTVQVYISTGPPIITYPSLSGITTCTGVTTAFQQVDLTANCSFAYSDTVPAGGLVSESPPKQAPQGSTVTVVLSQGPAPVAVPPIPSSGKLTDEINALQNAGLVAGNVYGPANGRVFQTNPPPGQMVTPGTAVNIYTL